MKKIKKIKKEIEQIAANLKDAAEKEQDANAKYELACRYLEAKLLGDFFFDAEKEKEYKKGGSHALKRKI